MKNLLDGGYDGVCGGCIFQRDGIVVRRWSGKKGSYKFGWMACNEALCLDAKILGKHGVFHEKYGACFDYDFQLRVLMDKGIKINCIVHPIIYFFAGGASNGSIADNKKAIENCYVILKDNGVRFAWFTLLCKCIIAFFAYALASKKDISQDLKKLPGFEEMNKEE
jgi:GT2 family glycosyltransferase